MYQFVYLDGILAPQMENRLWSEKLTEEKFIVWISTEKVNICFYREEKIVMSIFGILEISVKK